MIKTMAVIACSFFSLLTNAQVIGFDPIAHPGHMQPTKLDRNRSIINTNLLEDSEKIASYLQERMNFLNSNEIKQSNNCLSKNKFEHLLSLYAQGHFTDCSDFVKNCLKVRTPLEQKFIVQGARCAFENYDYESTAKLFTKAVEHNSFNKENSDATILQFATSAMKGIYPSKVNDILSKNIFWKKKDQQLALGLIELSTLGKSKIFNNNELLSFLDSRIQKANKNSRQYLMALRLKILSNQKDPLQAYQQLITDYKNFENPFDFLNEAYKLFFVMVNDGNFKPALNIYNAIVQSANPRSKFLPTEKNPLTYTEIREKYCHQTFMPEKVKQVVDNFVLSWKSNSISTNELLTQLTQSQENYLQYSDVQSILGSLYFIQGNDKLAKESYWKSHELCRFNNRAHWGLELLERKIKFLSFNDYIQNEKQLREIVSQIEVPSQISHFIPNYNSFPEESKKRIIYAARIWMPFINILDQENYKTYIKIPFEKLSDIEDLSFLKDYRIGPPDLPDYLFDNRLWDDVRGIGGEVVAADHDEVFQTVQGDYNLLGHEMTHQFHRYLETKNPSLFECIQKLYDNALKRDVFADSYAKTNAFEYFAQGITYFLIPESAPPRFGLNKSWAEKNDPELHMFLKSIESSNGILANIKCSI